MKIDKGNPFMEDSYFLNSQAASVSGPGNRILTASLLEESSQQRLCSLLMGAFTHWEEWMGGQAGGEVGSRGGRRTVEGM